MELWKLHCTYYAIIDHYYAVHWETGHCKYMSYKTIEFWAMIALIKAALYQKERLQN